MSRGADKSARVRRARGAFALALAVIATGGAEIGCAERTSENAAAPASSCACEPMGAPVVDPTLLAFLSKARAAHHEADLAEAGEDRPRAIRFLSQLALGPRPGGATPSPEVAEVIADTRARLADLRSATGAFDEASRDVEEGLGFARELTHFRGRLFEMRGVVEERRSKALAAGGDAAGSAKARQEALAAFEKAIEIQDDVIARALLQKDREGEPKTDAGPPP